MDYTNEDFYFRGDKYAIVQHIKLSIFNFNFLVQSKPAKALLHSVELVNTSVQYS